MCIYKATVQVEINIPPFTQISYNLVEEENIAASSSIIRG